MSEENLSTWMPTTSATVAFGIKRLLSEGKADAALSILLLEILKGKFGSAVTAFAATTPVSEPGIRLLLKDRTIESYATRVVYELAGFPYPLYPMFATCIDLTQEVISARKASPTPQISAFILEKALASPAVQGLNLNPTFINHLRLHIGSSAAQTPPQTEST